ncbi:F protein [Trabala vishnou gigantina nucleopolyhedrovirus]|uniref:F protein n=1 Tax=Trabala vishnou gigantina nucleopolyhedrovirus TaxID=2863583 RepID=UPI002481C07E|nr:F protein [Trabala vishnou gigantina nucleopolyhedrovirus]QYC92659.1 F protein [Trabala vishnou gigantina nucleopolyhedrovirus]
MNVYSIVTTAAVVLLSIGATIVETIGGDGGGTGGANKIVDSKEILTVTPLPHTSGLYYQPINKMQFVENLWTFVVEMDHSEIYLELDNLYNQTHKFIDYLNTKAMVDNCTRSSKVVQIELNTFVAKQIVNLVKKHNDLDSKIRKLGDYKDLKELKLRHPNVIESLSKIKGTREKRSLNFVGNVYKYLFGIMDSNDANLLHQVAQNDNALNKQVKQLTNELISLTNYMEHSECVEQHVNDACVYMDAKMNLFKAQIQAIEKLYVDLEKAVDDANVYKVNSLVITPKRLLEELTNVTMYLPKKISWPMPLELKNMHHYMNDLIKCHVFITENRKLLFMLEVPLIGQQVYNVYQVVPVPFCQNGKCVIIVPHSKYLGLSLNGHNYIRLDDDATKFCKITKDNLLCYKPKIVHDSNKAVLCDIKILLNGYSASMVGDVARDCDVRVGKFDDEIFYPISEYNDWLYVLQKDTRVVIVCTDDVTVLPITIAAGTGIINGNNMKYDCKFSTSTQEIPMMQVKSNLYSNIVIPISTSFNLSATLQDLDKLNIDLSKSTINLDHRSLNGMTERLIDLRKQMEHNVEFSKSDTAVDGDADASWFCWCVSFFGVSCHLAQSIIATVVLLFAALVVFRMYRCMCPGLCSSLCSSLCPRCHKRSKTTVIRVNSDLQFVDDKSHSKKKRNVPMVEYKNTQRPSKRFGNADDYDDHDNDDNDCGQVFIKKV